MFLKCSRFLAFLLALNLFACNEEKHLFVLKSEDTAPFNNTLEYTEDFNPYLYRNFYNGGGVALGDINNDGLIDVYFTGNIVDNKMFLNRGNWNFEDVTSNTRLACSGVWSSGANFVDINGDGWLDLYVCKAGKPGGDQRYNELFIHTGQLDENGIPQFEEKSAEYGLNITGLSIQSAFFDYDRDGDLDCYLLNNSLRSVGGFDLIPEQRNTPSENGNKFFENQDGKFVDVTEEVGIFSSAIGYGLGITLSDFDLDGWTDIYISNDFFEKDYLYLNNQDKTFTEQGEEYFECYPWGSMGADVADLDNDLMPDLMITEMLPHTVKRKKTKALYESWKKYSLAVSNGYYHQLPRNMLQRNMGNAGFLEVGRKAGVEATNWSWSSLMQDFDNDGLKDIIVANGIYKDLLDRDYLAFIADDASIKNDLAKGSTNAITKLIDAMPSQAVANFAFKNFGDFNFENYADEWGLDQKSFSNGCAYGDLDNDGDLDLVFNNVNMPSFIYENTSERSGYNYLKIKLQGKQKNTKAIGAKVVVYACGKNFMAENYPSRGFQSSISNHLLFGLGNCTSVDSLKIIWPNGYYDIHTNLIVNKEWTFAPSDHSSPFIPSSNAIADEKASFFTGSYDLGIEHQLLRFNQFNRERLLMKMNTVDGPVIALSDLNQDGVEDIFVGGAKGFSSSLLISKEDGAFHKMEFFEEDKRSEVVDAVFFDSDNDGDKDLYVAHGGTAFSPFASELHDVLYVNEGDGQWTKNKEAFKFPQAVATGAVAIADFDQDGLEDVFVGERNSNNAYGLPGSAYLFRNKGQQNFESIEIPEFKELGIITDAQWLDVNQDGLLDLIVVGEWMPITIFMNKNGHFEKEENAFAKTKGIWNTLLVEDFNRDGQADIFVGNIGSNSAIRKNHLLYINDFDKNGSVEQILAEQVDKEIYPSLDKDELMSQLPILKRKYVYYKDFAEATMEQLFDANTLEESLVLNLDVVESQLYFQKNGQFERQPLPVEVQFSSVHAVTANDFDKDGTLDLLIGGNHYLTKPQFGREDASKGWLLIGGKKGGDIQYDNASALNIDGQIRDFELLQNNKVMIGVVGQSIQVYSY